MAGVGGPDIVADGLVLALDAANNRGISPAANESFNNAEQFVINLAKPSDIITAYNGVKVGNLNYYTAFGIQYPEGNYGGAAAARDGITPGFNVTSGTKTYDCSRDLNMFVYDDDTDTWVSDSYFNGERINGHCYDTYDGQPSQHATFQADYDNIKATFPNATYIIIGSHAAENNDNDSATLSRLQELGFPDSQIGVSRPEYILVGKPGRNFVYAYENYSTDSAQVAHAVFPLPINRTNKNNYLEFDGTDDYVDIEGSITLGAEWSVEAWVYLEDGNDYTHIFSSQTAQTEFACKIAKTSDDRKPYFYKSGVNTFTGTSRGLNLNTWHHLVYTYDGSTIKVYIDTEEVRSVSATMNIGSDSYSIGDSGSTSEFGNFRLAKHVVRTKNLTASEVLQNYKATKARYGL